MGGHTHGHTTVRKVLINTVISEFQPSCRAVPTEAFVSDALVLPKHLNKYSSETRSFLFISKTGAFNNVVTEDIKFVTNSNLCHFCVVISNSGSVSVKQIYKQNLCCLNLSQCVKLLLTRSSAPQSEQRVRRA